MHAPPYRKNLQRSRVQLSRDAIAPPGIMLGQLKGPWNPSYITVILYRGVKGGPLYREGKWTTLQSPDLWWGKNATAQGNRQTILFKFKGIWSYGQFSSWSWTQRNSVGVHNQKENCPYDRIHFNLKRIDNVFPEARPLLGTRAHREIVSKSC